MTTIMIVNPNTSVGMTDAAVAAAREVAGPGTTLVGSTAERGVVSVESHVDEATGAVAVIEQVMAGEKAGTGGYVIACFGDTGVAAAREVAAGPVVGMTEAALATAAMLAARFAVVTLPPRTREQSHRVLRDWGLADRCEVRTVPVDVDGIDEAGDELLAAIEHETRRAVEHTAAEALVLGCAGLAHLRAPLTAALHMPVIDGVAAAVTMVDGLLAQGLTTSRSSTFAAPPRPLGAVTR